MSFIERRARWGWKEQRGKRESDQRGLFIYAWGCDHRKWWEVSQVDSGNMVTVAYVISQVSEVLIPTTNPTHLPLTANVLLVITLDILTMNKDITLTYF